MSDAIAAYELTSLSVQKQQWLSISSESSCVQGNRRLVEPHRMSLNKHHDSSAHRFINACTFYKRALSKQQQKNKITDNA